MSARQPVGPGVTPNERAEFLIRESILFAYLAALQREPSEEEIEKNKHTSLLTIDGIAGLLKSLLFSQEFISRFALSVSPMLLSRMMINQILLRSPISQDEIDGLAGQIFVSGWASGVDQFLS